MNRHKLWVIFVTLVAFLLSSCSNPDSVELVIDGTNLVRPGEKVEITALVGENVSELVWSITDESLGILAVSPDKPYQAFFTASPNATGYVTITASGEARADSIQLLVADLAIAGARGWHFTRQGGGEVQSPDNRGYGPNTVISHWDHGGHWLEWDLNMPKTDEYALIVRYATKRDPHLTKRELKVNGEVVLPVMTFRNTGGYAGPLAGSDLAQVSEWDTAVFPGIYLEAGTQSIRLTHVGDDPASPNGTNIAYIAFVTLGDLELTDDLLIMIENEIGVQRELRHWN